MKKQLLFNQNNTGVKTDITDGGHHAFGDALSADYIEHALRKKKIPWKISVEKQVDSTNNVLKKYAAEGEKEDRILLAEQQSAGRGRRGRSFYSPEGTGLYMSFLLHPDATPGEGTMLTTLTAVAAARAVEQLLGEAVQIKWVNDVWMHGKKIAGILTEGSPSLRQGRLEYVIVGIGFNIYEPEGGFPEELRHVAGALFADSRCRGNFRNRLAAEFIIRFREYYCHFPPGDHLEEYRKRCFVIGKRIEILAPPGTPRKGEEAGPDRTHGLVLGIDDACHLKVRYDDGTTEILSSGEISIRPER